MPGSSDAIAALLREAQASDPAVAEFAWVWLEAFRRDLMNIVKQHGQDGRAMKSRGEDPATVRKRTEERLENARRTLLFRLRRLMAWAKESGRGNA